jgi:hypothetical protein
LNANHTSQKASPARNGNLHRGRTVDVMHGSSPIDEKPSYEKVVQVIKDVIQLTVPAASTTLVISRGDDELLDLRGRDAWHFPRAVNGKFAGCYPANSYEAIAHLEQLRSQGAQYLLIPSTSFWWLEFYTDLTAHLQRKYHIVAFIENVCLMYRL